MTAPLSIAGTRLDPLTVDQLHDRLEKSIRLREHALVTHLNVHGANLAFEQPWLRDFFNRSDIVFCDGVGIRLGAAILGHKTPPRITYADWTWQLASFLESSSASIFLLGGRPGIADRAAARLRERFPRLEVAGTHHGYFDKRLGAPGSRSVIDMINSARPDVLLVAFGMPLQERWLDEHWEFLDAAVALTGGAALDYVSGALRRAPAWMTDHGLEWLGRLLIEPRRLWRRYLLGNPTFIWRILRQRLGRVPQAPTSSS